MDSILGRTILGYRVVEKIGSGGFGNDGNERIIVYQKNNTYNLPGQC